MAGKGKNIKGGTGRTNPALVSAGGSIAKELPEDQPREQHVGDQAKAGKKPPKGYKMNPAFVETKSRRFQLLMQPSLYEKLKSRSEAGGVSVNELIHSLLEAATSE